MRALNRLHDNAVHYWLMLFTTCAAISCLFTNSGLPTILALTLMGSAVLLAVFFHENSGLVMGCGFSAVIGTIFHYHPHGFVNVHVDKWLWIVAIVSAFYARFGVTRNWYDTDRPALRAERLIACLFFVAWIVPASLYGRPNVQVAVGAATAVLLVGMVFCFRQDNKVGAVHTIHAARR